MRAATTGNIRLEPGWAKHPVQPICASARLSSSADDPAPQAVSDAPADRIASGISGEPLDRQRRYRRPRRQPRCSSAARHGHHQRLVDNFARRQRMSWTHHPVRHRHRNREDQASRRFPLSDICSASAYFGHTDGAPSPVEQFTQIGSGRLERVIIDRHPALPGKYNVASRDVDDSVEGSLCC